MNRRQLLKGMLALPAAGLLGGCRHRFAADPSPTASGKTLAIVLHGPWAVVVRKNQRNRLNAFVPRINQPDLEKSHFQHEFRFRTPMGEPHSCDIGYRFELPHRGLVIAGRGPQIDRGFDDVRFSVNDWTPDWDDYFVGLELPAPDAISYIPPLYPLLFDLGQDDPGKLGSAPLSQVLEYRVSDADDIRLMPKPWQQCPKIENENRGYPPMTSDQLVEAYEALQRGRDQAADHGFSQRPFIIPWLKKHSRVFFLGVGVRPEDGPSLPMREYSQHGVWFFNEKLLPAIFQHGQPMPRGSRLKNIGRDVLPCEPGDRQSSSPTVTSAVWHPEPRPHVQYVLSNQNCSSPGVIATTPATPRG